MRAAKIIALLLPHSLIARRDERDVQTDAVPVRREIESQMSFAEQSMTTGAFRRGKAIIDPLTHEVIGYEMEMLSDPEMRMSSARLQLGY